MVFAHWLKIFGRLPGLGSFRTGFCETFRWTFVYVVVYLHGQKQKWRFPVFIPDDIPTPWLFKNLQWCSAIVNLAWYIDGVATISKWRLMPSSKCSTISISCPKIWPMAFQQWPPWSMTFSIIAVNVYISRLTWNLSRIQYIFKILLFDPLSIHHFLTHFGLKMLV